MLQINDDSFLESFYLIFLHIHDSIDLQIEFFLNIGLIFLVFLTLSFPPCRFPFDNVNIHFFKKTSIDSDSILSPLTNLP